MFEQNKNIIPLGSTQDPLASTEPEPDGSEGAGPFVSHTWSGDSEACRARGGPTGAHMAPEKVGIPWEKP
jgi:hypothetical protein